MHIERKKKGGRTFVEGKERRKQSRSYLKETVDFFIPSPLFFFPLSSDSKVRSQFTVLEFPARRRVFLKKVLRHNGEILESVAWCGVN